MKQGTRHTSFREIFRAYIHAARDVRHLIPFQLLLLAFDGIIQSMIPATLGYIVERMESDPAAFIQQDIWPIAGILVLASVLFYGAAWLQHYWMHKIGTSTMIRFQSDLYAHLQRLGADFYHRTHVGEITSRLTADVYQGVSPFYYHFAHLFWIASLLVPASLTMASLDKRLFGIFLATATLSLLVVRCMIPVMRQLQRRVQDEMGRLNARITEDVASAALIRSFAQEEEAIDRLRWHSRTILGLSLRAAGLGFLFSDLLQTLMKVFAPLFLVLAGIYLGGPAAKLSVLVTFFGYWQTAVNPLSNLLDQIVRIFQSFACFDRIIEFFRETPMVKDTPGAREVRLRGAVTFDNITFRYPVGEGDLVLDRLSFTAPARENLAIVGESGAGKSTIVQLLLRFYDPLGGAVRIDGVDLREIQQQSLRRQIGFVMQETILLSGTIRQNMLFAKPDASDDEIVAALRHAEAWRFVEETPDRLDTILGERGVRLSGGQKQRLSIARVFLKNPPIVILDEATSALDTITEKQIQETMRRLFEGRTSVVIAHRLSTIVDCDHILVLDKGRILAEGTHAELLEACPYYRTLCEKQRIQTSS